MSAKVELRELEALLVDMDLQELEQRLGKFNIFDALGVARAEIRHSNFLAWLLDPYGSHGQGDLFLKGLLIDLLRRAPVQARPCSPVVIEGVELRGVEIRREWRNIDLLILSKDPSLVVVIENKVDSDESSGQLDRYERTARDLPGVTKPLFVFLTPDGRPASDDNWIPYSYGNLHAMLLRTSKLAGAAIGADVLAFLGHYLNLLKGRFMNDKEMEDLCRTIYKNHKRAFDVIYEHAFTQSPRALQAVEERLRAAPDRWVVRLVNGAYVVWVPQSWVGVVSQADGAALPSSPCDLYLEVELWRSSRVGMSARLIVGPAADQARRKRVLDALAGADFNLKSRNKAPGSKWTRLGAEVLAEWDIDEEVPEKALILALDKWIDGIEPRLDRVAGAVSRL